MTATIRCSGSPSCACPWHYPEGYIDQPLTCGSCGQAPEAHGDSDHGPMSVCSPQNGSTTEAQA